MNGKLGRKVTLREDSFFANDGTPSNRTGFIGVVHGSERLGGQVWHKVRWSNCTSNVYEEEDLLWYDYVDDWKEVVRSWGGDVDE